MSSTAVLAMLYRCAALGEDFPSGSSREGATPMCVPVSSEAWQGLQPPSLIWFPSAQRFSMLRGSTIPPPPRWDKRRVT